MSAERKLWLGLAALLAVSFSVLLWVGTEIHRQMPPIPSTVVSSAGETVFTRADIETGRQVWQSIGGHQLGSIWGHGSYVAPDWTADWLHREAVAWLDQEASAINGQAFSAQPDDVQASMVASLKPRIRANTYDAATDQVTLDPARVAAIRHVASHYQDLFGDAPALTDLRRAYAMKTVPSPKPRIAKR